MTYYLSIFRPMNYTHARYFIVATCLLLLITPADGQQKSGWSVLTDVAFISRKDSVTGFEVESPVFGEKVLVLEGKRIELRGYIVPLEEMQGHKYFVLSSLPYNVCFFCGGAGPETVAEVYLKNEIAYTDDAISISGILHLNPTDPLHLMYILKDAEIVNSK